MKKVILSITTFGMLATGSVFASESTLDVANFKGSRIGIGMSQTKIEAEFKGDSIADIDYGSGVKLEYGYDFNQIVGFGLSYETNSETLYNDFELEGRSFKLSADIGYAFPIQSIYLKPYAKVGYQFYSEEAPEGYLDYSDDSILFGLGLRFQYSHFYADITVDYFSGSDVYFDYSYNQTGLTVGYKF